MEVQKVATMFEELFLTEEEEKIYQLQKLEKRFILSEEEMLWELEKKKIEALDYFKRANKSFQNYKRHLLNSKGLATQDSINRNYTQLKI